MQETSAKKENEPDELEVRFLTTFPLCELMLTSGANIVCKVVEVGTHAVLCKVPPENSIANEVLFYKSSIVGFSALSAKEKSKLRKAKLL